MVGKLAAGVAHSIRNPLTSVKMRLFSMKRSLELSASQKEDFEVISEEIRHIDTIVRNFLEFSRPPKLKMQRISPSDVVDLALSLLHNRLESYGVEVKLIREQRLPEIWADPEQLKEVLVNLVVNACEAMVGGGAITIQEEEEGGGAPGPGGGYPGQRYRPRHPGVHPGQGLPTLFQHQGRGHRPGPEHRPAHHQRPRRPAGTESKKKEGATFIITLPREDEIMGTHLNCRRRPAAPAEL